MKKSLEVLAGASPKITYRTFASAAAKIKTLEATLGLPPGKPTWNVLRANARIAELESMAAARATTASIQTPAAASVAPAVFVPDPNLSADAQIAAAIVAGVATNPAGQRLRAQRAALAADMGKLRGVSLECANQILKK